MKKLIEESEEGLIKLMGERITLLCCRYIYTGKLVGVNEDCVLLEDAGIVYETGEWTSKDWSDYQELPNDVYVVKSAIESYGLMK